MAKRIKHRDWGRADDDADTFPAVTDEPMSDDEDVEDERIDDEHIDDESPRSARAPLSAKSLTGSTGSARRWWPGCHASAPRSPAGCCCA